MAAADVIFQGTEMEEEARLVLETIVRSLDDTLPGDPSSWAKSVEELDPTDEDSLMQFPLVASITLSLFQGQMEAISKTLYGTNMLTPALVRKGWMFWRKLPVTEDEKKAIEAAFFQYVACLQSLSPCIQEIRQAKVGLEQLPPMNRVSELSKVATALDKFCSCVQRYSDDLKQILEGHVEPS